MAVLVAGLLRAHRELSSIPVVPVTTRTLQPNLHTYGRPARPRLGKCLCCAGHGLVRLEGRLREKQTCSMGRGYPVRHLDVTDGWRD